jgi:hypothetical protein
MENPLKPSPLVGEILPGFTAIVILGIAFGQAHSVDWYRLASSPTTGAGLGAVFVILLAAWVLGSVADSVRNIVEELFLDRRWPVNWEFLFHAPTDSIGKLSDSWLAYYFLSCNFAITLLAVALAGCSFGAVHIAWGWVVGLLVAAVVLGYDAWISRKEIRRLIGRSIIAHPHDQVYTRIGISKIKPSAQYGEEGPGVGVIAIRDIPVGALVFSPDDDETVIALKRDVDRLPEALRKLYTDFCVQEGNSFTCPVSFNKLTPAWYVNDAADDHEPNVKPDESLRFFAIRDIREGEELLARYEDYSD